MNILISTFGADGGKSGISRYIIKLLEAFNADPRGHRFHVITFEDETDIFCRGENLHPIPMPASLRNPVRCIAWNLTSMASVCRKTKADVLFLPAANRRVAWSVPCPMVGVVHDFSSLHVPGKYDWKRMLYIKRVLPILIRRLDHVVTISSSSKKDIIDFARYGGDITVTPLAADKSQYHPRPKDEEQARVWKQYGFEGPYVLYISRLEHPGKNHVSLIAAFEKVKSSKSIPHKLVLAGSDWNGAEEVHRVAQGCSCADDIIFTGFAKDDILPSLYAGADAFVFPSLYEGFGLPVLEALSCGVPTACSNVSSMPEVAGDAALLFDPKNDGEIATCIDKLLTDRALAARLREDGLKRAEQFSWQATASATLDVLEETAKRKTR